MVCRARWLLVVF